MIERDYIMRMITMLTTVIQKLLGLKKSHDYPQALFELETASHQILGIPLSLLESLPDDQLLELYKTEEDSTNAKLFVVGTLLKEKADVTAEQGRPEESIALSLKALRLLLEAFLPHGIPVDDSHRKNIEDLVARLTSFAIPSILRAQLVAYYECCHQYDRAEDVLFELVDQDPQYLDAGIAFYERLRAKDAADLTAGNLPRAEVEEGLGQLRKRRG
jgi:hypothetical protein